ncbi:hypothetical protein [Actinomadura formosensis]|uniref:hypothetical protein n=1 Tax=Actinomadura formosensis TaxID=60706 RepID=UPI00082C4739|nr:hypothetical protein [Actinomadura formosensis]
MFTSSFLAIPTTVDIARNFAKLVAIKWGYTADKDDNVFLVVPELVTNSSRATKHTEIWLTLTEHVLGRITIEVWGESPELRWHQGREERSHDAGDPDGAAEKIAALCHRLVGPAFREQEAEQP